MMAVVRAGIELFPFIRNLNVANNPQGSQLLTVTPHLMRLWEANIEDCATIDNYWLLH